MLRILPPATPLWLSSPGARERVIRLPAGVVKEDRNV
jgi:hypothetical protein